MRKLVSIRKIRNILNIENSDNLELAIVDSWEVVVKKNQFKIGEDVVYFEIDSFLPDGNPAWDFLVKKSSRTFKGIRGHVLKTAKIRGCISQGFILPISDFPSLDLSAENISEQLGVVKYEIDAETYFGSAYSKGAFPYFFPKTDQERVQNLKQDEIDKNLNKYFTLTEKLEGQSMSVFYYNGNTGVCSRNVYINHETSTCRHAATFNTLDLGTKLNKLEINIAVQGELVGPGIQSNIYGLKNIEFFVFAVWDIDTQKYLDWHIVNQISNSLGLRTVPVVGYTVIPQDVKAILEIAKGYSQLNSSVIREGIVCWQQGSMFSFKAINNDYLLKK